MAVINLTITESAEQVIAGIPKSVTITSNIPSSIFYTLDGSTPTLFSNIYTGPVLLPINQLSVILSIMATNGVDSSPVIVDEYTTNILGNTRLAHSATDSPAGSNIPGLYPFGTPPAQPIGNFLNPGDAGTNVNDPALPTQSTGFDGDGYPNAFTNKPYTSENYDIVYTTRNATGESIVGNLPAQVKIENQPPAPEESTQFTNLFDPRAFVIFQDFSKEDPNGPIQINRQFFTLENPERARDGNAYYTSGLDAPPVSGSFLRSHYNPRDNTITYYYLDTWTNRWIISKTPYQPTGTFNGNLSNIATAGGGKGNKFTFEWLPFTRRILF